MKAGRKMKLLEIFSEEVACKGPYLAYWFARYVPGADIRKCEEAACKDPHWAYYFALKVPGADIKKCQEAAYKNPRYAYLFAYYLHSRA